MPLSRIITQTDWFPDLTQLPLHICVHLQITLQTMVDMEGDLFFFAISTSTKVICII